MGKRFLQRCGARSNVPCYPDGSGLGLPLAQQIAREHRGALSYRSRPGHTVFTLLLPIGDPADGAGPTEAAA